MDVLGSDAFSMQLAAELNARHIRIENRCFPDGEICPRIMERPNTNGEVILAQRMALPMRPNIYLTEILLTLRNLKMMGITNVSLVMPYFIYSRQDRSHLPGEPVSACHVLDILNDAGGVSKFYTVSSHMERFKSELTAPMRAFNLDGYSILGTKLNEMELVNPLVMGPDMTVNMAAMRVADILGTQSFSIEKKRDFVTGEIDVREFSRNLNGRDIVIVDDIISTGKTMAQAIGVAKKCGCGRIVVASVHVVSHAGLELLNKHAWKIISTDTINNPVSHVSVVKRVADAIRENTVSSYGSDSQYGTDTNSSSNDNDYPDYSQDSSHESSGSDNNNGSESNSNNSGWNSNSSETAKTDNQDDKVADGTFSMFD